MYQPAVGFVDFKSLKDNIQDIGASLYVLEEKENPRPSHPKEIRPRNGGVYNHYYVHTGPSVSVSSSSSSGVSEKEKKESRDRWHAFFAIIGMVGSSLCIGWTYHRNYKAYTALKDDIDVVFKKVFLNYKDFEAVTTPLSKQFSSDYRDAQVKTVFDKGPGQKQNVVKAENQTALVWTYETCLELLKIRDAALERIAYQKGILLIGVTFFAGSACVLSGALLGVTAFKVIGVVEVTLALCTLFFATCSNYIHKLSGDGLRKKIALLLDRNIFEEEGMEGVTEEETIKLKDIQMLFMPQNPPYSPPEAV